MSQELDELDGGPWTRVTTYCEQWIRDCAFGTPALYVSWERAVNAVFHMEELHYIVIRPTDTYGLLMRIRVPLSEYEPVWRRHFYTQLQVPG